MEGWVCSCVYLQQAVIALLQLVQLDVQLQVRSLTRPLLPQLLQPLVSTARSSVPPLRLCPQLLVQQSLHHSVHLSGS